MLVKISSHFHCTPAFVFACFGNEVRLNKTLARELSILIKKYRVYMTSEQYIEECTNDWFAWCGKIFSWYLLLIVEFVLLT